MIFQRRAVGSNFGKMPLCDCRRMARQQGGCKQQAVCMLRFSSGSSLVFFLSLSHKRACSRTEFVVAYIVGKPFDVEAATLHAPEPCHLSFGKLMYGDFELLLHVGTGQLSGDTEGKILVFKTVINEVVGAYAGVEQALCFVEHSFVEACLQSTADARAPFVAVYVKAYDYVFRN